MALILSLPNCNGNNVTSETMEGDMPEVCAGGKGKQEGNAGTLIPDGEKPSASSMSKVCFSTSAYPAISIQGGSEGDVKRNTYIMRCFAEECGIEHL